MIINISYLLTLLKIKIRFLKNNNKIDKLMPRFGLLGYHRSSAVNTKMSYSHCYYPQQDLPERERALTLIYVIQLQYNKIKVFILLIIEFKLLMLLLLSVLSFNINLYQLFS